MEKSQHKIDFFFKQVREESTAAQCHAALYDFDRWSSVLREPPGINLAENLVLIHLLTKTGFQAPFGCFDGQLWA